jgi:nucleotide-binding universal stress UspA family protein
MPRNLRDSTTKLLVAIDFSDQSLGALRAAERLAVASSAELHLIHVLPARSDTDSPARGGRRERALTQVEEFRERLDELAAGVVGAVRHVAGHLRRGTPDTEIAELARTIGADLIVVGTHGRRGLDRLLLGSVAERLVRHASCSVLVHRADASSRIPRVRKRAAAGRAAQR